MGSMELIFEIPSKTFLAGEYLALEGGPALIANTDPCFQITVSQGGSASHPFHPNSPAGHLWKQHKGYFEDFKIELLDPHGGRGGFGASTAQFAALHVLLQMQESAWTEAQMDIDVRHAWTDYRNICENCGISPSGADLIGQLTGGLTFFERTAGRLEMFAWPFENLKFVLVRTNQKLSTHEHLLEKPKIDDEKFRPAMKMIEAGLVKLDANHFIEGIQKFSKELEVHQLVAANTLNLLTDLNSASVLAAKGCGAMGADVIALFFESRNSGEVYERINTMGLEIVASSENVTSGLRKKISFQKLDAQI